MIDTRLKKAIGDLWSDRARTILVVLAIAIGIFSVGAVLTGYAILDREMNANYMTTTPASATLYLDHADAGLLALVKNDSAIQDAELRRTVTARVQTGENQWQNAELYVLDDFSDQRISTVTLETGSWPAENNQILFERVALPLTGKGVGDDVVVKTSGGQEKTLRIAGTVHAPGLAPANMENLAYGYINRETLQSLGEAPEFDQLLILVADDSSDEAAIKSTAYRLKGELEQQGYTVKRIEVPHPGKHPHAGQMSSLMFLFEAFGALSFLLSLVLVVNMITGLLARQIREIGIMKAVGATTGQIMAIYLGGVLVLAVIATVLALPASVLAGQALATIVAGMLNFNIYSNAIPAWVFAVTIGLGLVVPVLAAVAPVYRGGKVTVQQAINDYGLSSAGRAETGFFGRLAGLLPGLSRPLLLALRNTFRKRERLALTLLTLSVGGSLFMVAMSLSSSMDLTVDNALDVRHFNELVAFSGYYPEAGIVGNLTSVPGVTRVECMDRATASLTYADGTDSNSFTLFAVRPDSDMVSYPVLEGRWLQPGDTNSVVLNHMLAHELAEQGDGRELHPGDSIALNLNGQRSTWKVVGIAREMMAPPRAYVSLDYYSGLTGLNGLANTAVIATGSGDVVNSSSGFSIHGISFSHGQARVSPPESVLPAIESKLAGSGMNVASVASIGDMRVMLKEHLGVIMAFVTCMAGMAVAVGILGLASTMGINVLERRREYGIMRAIGATGRSISGILVAEALVIGLISWAIAAVIAVPISIAIGSVFGTIFFQSPLDIAVSHPGMVLWLVLVLILAPAACLLSARKSARLPVHEVLAYE